MNDPDIAGHLRTIRVWSSDSFPMVSRSAGFHLKICHSRGLQLRCASRNCWAVGRYSLRGLDRISQRLELQELPRKNGMTRYPTHSKVIHVIFCFILSYLSSYYFQHFQFVFCSQSVQVIFQTREFHCDPLAPAIQFQDVSRRKMYREGTPRTSAKRLTMSNV